MSKDLYLRHDEGCTSQSLDPIIITERAGERAWQDKEESMSLVSTKGGTVLTQDGQNEKAPSGELRAVYQ